MEPVKIKVGGVCCSHCDTKIKHAIAKVEGVNEVFFNKDSNEAYVIGNFDLSQVEGAITALGYSIIK